MILLPLEQGEQALPSRHVTPRTIKHFTGWRTGIFLLLEVIEFRLIKTGRILIYSFTIKELGPLILKKDNSIACLRWFDYSATKKRDVGLCGTINSIILQLRDSDQLGPPSPLWLKRQSMAGREQLCGSSQSCHCFLELLFLWHWLPQEVVKLLSIDSAKSPFPDSNVSATTFESSPTSFYFSLRFKGIQEVHCHSAEQSGSPMPLWFYHQLAIT